MLPDPPIAGPEPLIPIAGAPEAPILVPLEPVVPVLELLPVLPLPEPNWPMEGLFAEADPDAAPAPSPEVVPDDPLATGIKTPELPVGARPPELVPPEPLARVEAPVPALPEPGVPADPELGDGRALVVPELPVADGSEAPPSIAVNGSTEPEQPAIAPATPRTPSAKGVSLKMFMVDLEALPVPSRTFVWTVHSDAKTALTMRGHLRIG